MRDLVMPKLGTTVELLLVVRGFGCLIDDVLLLLLLISCRSIVAEGPRTRVVNFCNKLEQESLNSWATLVVVDEREYRVLRGGAVVEFD